MTHRLFSSMLGSTLQRPSVLGLGVAALLLACLTACGTARDAAPAAHPYAVLQGATTPATFTQVRHAIAALYHHNSDITRFQVQAVTYTPKTRDKVLKVCREGSIARSARELESQRVMACAPLIYFFDRYGVQRSVPQAITVARELLGYSSAYNRHPYGASKVLTALLRSWGVK